MSGYALSEQSAVGKVNWREIKVECYFRASFVVHSSTCRLLTLSLP